MKPLVIQRAPRSGRRVLALTLVIAGVTAFGIGLLVPATPGRSATNVTIIPSAGPCSFASLSGGFEPAGAGQDDGLLPIERPPLPRGLALVQVNNGDVTFDLVFDGHRTGSAHIEDGLRGSYLRQWSERGDTFSLHLIRLWLPSVRLPLPGGPGTGPIKILEATGDFAPGAVSLLGPPNRGQLLLPHHPDILRETLGLEVDFPLLAELGERPLRVLLQKMEFGYSRLPGAALVWEAQGFVTEGRFHGTLITARGSCKSADYVVNVTTSIDLPTGVSSMVTSCTVGTPGIATCTPGLRLAGGFARVTCTAVGVTTVTVNWVKGSPPAAQPPFTKTVRCA